MSRHRQYRPWNPYALGIVLVSGLAIFLALACVAVVVL